MGIFDKDSAPKSPDTERTVSDVPDLATVRAMNAALQHAREASHRRFLEGKERDGDVVVDKKEFLDSGNVPVITADMERPSDDGPEPEDKVAS